jgi:hypothetical protein
MPLDTRIALSGQPLQVQFRDPIASYNQLAQLTSADTQNQLAQMQMQEARQLAPLRLQEQQSRAASTKLTYDQAKQAQDFVTGVMSKAAENSDGKAPTDPSEAAMQMLQHPNPQVQAIGGHLLDASQKLMAYRQQAQFMKDEGGALVAPTPAGAPAVTAPSVNDVRGSLTAPGAAVAPVGFNTSARLIQPEGKSYADMSNTERIQFDVARIQNPQLGQPQAVYTLDGKEVPFREYVNANIANSTFKPDNALAAAVAPDVASAPAVNAMIPAVASALQNADALKKEIEKGDRTYGSAPGWKSKRELLVEAYKQALKPGRTDTTFAAINPSDYTQDSVKAFLVSKNYGDLVPKAGKADKLVGAVNPSDYTPASIAAFNLSGNYGDLIAKAGKTDKLIGNVNPSDYTSESVAAFSLSNNYSDLVLKPAKADKVDRTIANVNPDSYTPASVAAFALSGNYADLVLRPEKAKDSKNIANVNPNDFTPASIEKFVASGKYSDLVPVKKASEGGAGGERLPVGSMLVIDPADPTGKKIITVTTARAIKEGLIPASSVAKEEKLKPIPANINTAISTNDMSIKRIQEALDLIKKNPDAIGLKNLLPGQALDRMDPKGVAARSAIGDIGSLVIHDRSGAAVSASEMQRLNFIPTPTDRADNAKTKLEAMLKYAKLNQQGLAETYAEDQGYKPNPTISGKSKVDAGEWKVVK